MTEPTTGATAKRRRWMLDPVLMRGYFEVPTVGTSPDGTVVARFTFTWSFKVRERRG